MKKIFLRISLCAFVIFPLLTFNIDAWAQGNEAGVVSGKVGLLEFRIPGMPGWRESAEVRARVVELMRSEGVNQEPAFAFENAKTGGMLFGAWTTLRPGLAFDAEEISAEPPWFPDSWGLKLSQIDGIFVPSNKGMPHARLRAAGMGDGKTFSGKFRNLNTLGIWVTMPIQYETVNGIGSGVVTLDYRGPDIADSKSQKLTGDTLMGVLIDGLKLQNGVRLISLDGYRAKYPKEVAAVTKERSSPELPANVAQVAGSADAGKSGSSSKDLISAINQINQPLVSGKAQTDAARIPTAPKDGEPMMQKCSAPSTIPSEGTPFDLLLGLVLETRNNNTSHLECARRLDQWIDWYSAQKGKK
jgi:hypothetical protein